MVLYKSVYHYPHMPTGKVWIYWLLFVFCVFVWLRRFIGVQGMESHTLGDFVLVEAQIGQIGQRSGHAHPHVNITIEMRRL